MSDHVLSKIPAETVSSSLLAMKIPLSLTRQLLLPYPPVTPGSNPVLLLPGLAASDLSTYWLRLQLRRKGYQVYGSELLRNEGSFETHRVHLEDRLKEISSETGLPVDIIGWSMGGRFALHLAASHSAEVGKIITLGSPLLSPEIDPLMEQAWIMFLTLAGIPVDNVRKELETDSLLPGPEHPLTSIIGHFDAVVHANGATIPASELGPGNLRENIFVTKGHLGLGFSTVVRDIIDDRLSQKVSSWKVYANADA